VIVALHVIVGAGSIGSATAQVLAADDQQVRIVTRRGSGPTDRHVERVAADATDAGRLAELTRGAAAVYNCANPPYHRWPTEWPPLAAAPLRAAQSSGAVLVTMSNLYGYGPVAGPMTEDLPLRPSAVKGRIRAQMWADALAAHDAGRIRATEARASDFLGPGAQSAASELIFPRVRAGKRVYAPINFDVPHSNTYTIDVARMLVTLGADERAWGRAWHVPTNPPTTFRELAVAYARLVGARAPRLRTMSGVVLRLGGLFSPVAREFVEMRYQFDRPFELDSSAAQRTFGLAPTPMNEILASMV
jgi:nucleoside-diphosphate-sugar epimerase